MRKWEQLREEEKEVLRTQANNLMPRLLISLREEAGGGETVGQAALRGYYGASKASGG
jgi:hypothetical protein